MFASGILIWSYPPHSRCNSSNSAIIRSFVSFWFPFQKNNLHYRGVFRLGSTVLCVLVNNWQFHLRPRKLIWHWKIPIFNRKYIFTHGGFSSQSRSFFGFGHPFAATKTRWWSQIIFYFYPYLGKWSNLTNMCQMGWFNHPPNVFTNEGPYTPGKVHTHI